MSLSGVGALAGALTMAAVSKGGPKKMFLYVFPLIAGALVMTVGFTNVYIIAGATLLLVSFFYMIFMASVNTTMQMNAQNEFRGRVMSVYSLVVAGSTPLGNLYAGAFAENISSSAGFVACGAAIVILLAPLYLLLKKRNPATSNA
jgi:predicted MFS family arabinose efflux permease